MEKVTSHPLASYGAVSSLKFNEYVAVNLLRYGFETLLDLSSGCSWHKSQVPCR